MFRRVWVRDGQGSSSLRYGMRVRSSDTRTGYESRSLPTPRRKGDSGLAWGCALSGVVAFVLCTGLRRGCDAVKLGKDGKVVTTGSGCRKGGSLTSRFSSRLMYTCSSSSVGSVSVRPPEGELALKDVTLGLGLGGGLVVSPRRVVEKPGREEP